MLYLGHYYFTLGVLLEAIENGTHIYFENLEGFKKLHLISIIGSSLNGRNSALFWSNETYKFVHSREINDYPAVNFSLILNFENYEIFLKTLILPIWLCNSY